MARFYGTFGQGSIGRNLYVVIEAEDYEAARVEMHRRYGIEWAFLYREDEKADAIDRFDLTELVGG